MKKTEKSTKLKLNREVIRTLTAAQLVAVIGGVGTKCTSGGNTNTDHSVDGAAPTTCSP